MAEGFTAMDDKKKSESSEQPTTRRRLTPIDIQQKVFRRAVFRGYHEQDVDDFLDEITEELALLLDEVRQLRDRTGMSPIATGATSGDVSEALRSADDIVRRAREEAEDILRRARTTAAGPAGGSGPSGSMLHPFLAHERTFLQDLSQLIQRHADTVRDMARSRRTAPAPAAPAETPAPAAAEAESSDTVDVGEAEDAEPAEDRA